LANFTFLTKFSFRFQIPIRTNRFIIFWCVNFSQLKKRNEMYRKPEAAKIQELKDIAHRLRIHSITSTQASKSG
jgi:hypothetical protein